MASPRIAALAAAAVAALAATAAVTTSGAAAAPPSCGVLFDDFAYSSHTDPAFTQHGWVPRSYAGGPGVPGATWAPQNITFPTVSGNKVAQLRSSTNGTAAGTTHTEIYSSAKRFWEGTYASRVKFSDTPTSGPDGDHVNQTFFTISPLNGDMDPTYSELDFSEYLPNGGWGEQGPINYQTTWYTYRADPWFADNLHSEQRKSMDGWHDIVAQVADGHVKYYIDGVLVGDHSGKWYPRQTMTLNFNHWFIDTAAHTGGMSTYDEQVDWVYYAKNQVVSPAAAVAAAAAYRSSGTAHTDTVDSSGGCQPTPGPTTAPPTTAPPTTAPPTTAPPTTGPPPTTCADAPAWAWGTVYLENARVTHVSRFDNKKHLWRARWWTQGSEPSWTAQWEDLGRCA